MAAIGGVAVLVAFLVVSAARDMTQLELTLFTIILSLVQLGVGVYVSVVSLRHRVSESYRPFVRGALRRAYLQSDQLDQLLEALKVGRLTAIDVARTGSADSVLIGLIERAEDRVGDLRRQVDSGIEDWRELMPAEVQPFDRLAAERAAEVTSLQNQESLLASFRHEIQELSPTSSGALGSIDRALRAVQSDIEDLRATAFGSTSRPKGELRQLLTSGAFEEAVEVYTEMMRQAPNNHSLYIGRARARYLAGDSRAALADLDTAEALSPDDPVVNRLREQVLAGTLPSPSRGAVPRYSEPSYRAANHLAQGQLEEAQAAYDEARSAGLMPIFCRTNDLMVAIAAQRPNLEDELHAYEKDAIGPFMKVQAASLRAIHRAQQDGIVDVIALSVLLAGIPGFDLRRSPLAFLQRGLQALGIYTDSVGEIFSMLE